MKISIFNLIRNLIAIFATKEEIDLNQCTPDPLTIHSSSPHPRYATPRHTTPRHTTPRHTTPHHATTPLHHHTTTTPATATPHAPIFPSKHPLFALICLMSSEFIEICGNAYACLSNRIPLLTITLLFISLRAEVEIIGNPGQSSDVYCPTTKDCTIICNETDACKSSKFYLNSPHSITIECSALQSCKEVTIYGSSVASLHIVASGPKSLENAALYSYSNDSNINVECIGSFVCALSVFHYMNHGSSNMTCDGERACQKVTVHAMVPLYVYCGSVGINVCERMSVILATDRALNNQSVITLSGNHYATAEMPIIIKSLFDFRNVICIDGCIADKIYISYGIQFDYYCKVSDASCINSASTKVANTDTLTVINTYSVAVPSNPSWFDFSGSTFGGDVLIIYSDRSIKDVTFAPPVMNDNAWLSILCVSCGHFTFQLSSIQNAVVTVAGHWGLGYSSIYSSQNHFKMNSYRWANFNVFHLEDAATITINGLSGNADVYLGDNTNVTINCRSTDSPLYGCSKTELWSSLITSQARFGDAFWSIDCPTADGCDDYFYIRFDFEQYPCTYYDYTSNCSFLHNDMDPTASPVSHNPTRSPTKRPTASPTEYPIMNPTQLPSKQPTALPTHFPTTVPTPLCDSMSLEVGVTNGAFDKSEFEGLFTLNPTLFFNRPWWVMPQSTDHYIKYIGASWSIHGNDGNALIFVSNDDFPPINSDEPIWQHSGTQGYYVVLLTCVDSYSPTMKPTTLPLPTTAEPTTAEPTTAEPTTAEPTTAEPTTAEPTTVEPTTSSPTTAEPTTVEPTTATPTEESLFSSRAVHINIDIKFVFCALVIVSLCSTF